LSVQLKIWGCRGSVPTPGPDTVEYGGNTSCVEIRASDDVAIVLDAGSGIRALGAELLARGTRRVHVFLTHLHLDHLEGLRFFAPLWDERVTVDLWGPPSPVASLRDRILRSFSPPLFPLDFRDIPARITFHDLPRPWSLDGLSLTADFVLHPGPTLGFRIDTGASTAVYLPDHEPALAGIAGKSTEWISGGWLCRGADLLLHDAQYFDDEYGMRIGWGHSSVDDAVSFARAAGVRQLVLFHHEPTHSDRTLEQLEDQARDLARGGLPPPVLAREGMTLELE
jgi:phosphoribosyl 1,2-cyclic phosphodiesterase